MNEVTRIIEQIQAGSSDATQALLPMVYEELRQLAANRMQHERDNHTLTPTALVHEAYLRLTGKPDDVKWNGQGHFFAAASEAMRRILIDHARKKNATKRGGKNHKFDLAESWLVLETGPTELIELDDALTALERADAEAALLVKLRFFAGMTNDQAAEHLKCSPRKADMLWAFARSWLKRELSS